MQFISRPTTQLPSYPDKTVADLSKDIWKYLILKQITITTEYLPGILNTRADWQSRQQGLLGMEIISNSIPTYLPENGDASVEICLLPDYPIK